MKRTLTVEGHEMIEKKVGKSGTGGYIYVPLKWAGKKVLVVLLDPLDDDND